MGARPRSQSAIIRPTCSQRGCCGLFSARKIWPAILKARPDARFFAVGSSPTPAVLSLARDVPGVTVTGTVDDVKPYLEDATVFVAPIRLGEGIKGKILEAFSCGLPVVATRRSLRGLELVPGRDVLPRTGRRRSPLKSCGCWPLRPCAGSSAGADRNWRAGATNGRPWLRAWATFMTRSWPCGLGRKPVSYRVLALIPAWWSDLPPAEADRTSALLRELGAKWGVAVVLDPGGVDLHRNGMRFAQRAHKDFFEQVKEAIFDAPVDAILAVGEAARVENLHRIAGWAPETPRAILLRKENFALSWRDQIPGACKLADLVLLGDVWPDVGTPVPDELVPVRTAADVCAQLRRRFLTARPAGSAPQDLGRDGVSVLVPAPDGALRRDFGRLPFPCESVTVQSGRNEVAAWNSALKRARYRCVLMLGPKIRLDGASLCRMREYLETKPLAAVAAARGRFPRSGSHRKLTAARLLAGGGHRECSPHLDCSCWMLRRDALRLAGRLDDRFRGARNAVLDYCLRLRHLGLRLLTATDVLAFSAQPRVLSSQDMNADRELLRRKWCLGATAALETLCRRDPT